MNNNPFELDFNNFIYRKNYQFDSINESFESSNFSERNAVVQRETIEENKLRQLFKRHSTNQNKGIGKHPDFQNLASTDITKNQYICPLFIDIKDSTRLGLKYDLEFVSTFKNAVIQMCIEVVRAFDGYVHRIMGDAVLVFFGSSTISKEQSILDMLTAISILDLYLIEYVKPWLKQQKPDFDENVDFGFRIGCNFGNDDEVLWSNYGYWQAGEVSPTGFPIDVASKLQSLANKNTTMLGKGLLEYINFPDEFSKKKYNSKNECIQYVKPNFTDPKTKRPINYDMRLFKVKDFLKGVLINTEFKKNLFPNDVISSPKFTMNVQYYYQNNWNELTSEIFIPKGSKIKVSISVTRNVDKYDNFTVDFQKINHKGSKNESSFMNKFKIPEMLRELLAEKINPLEGKNTVFFERDCEYRGIHRIVCSIKDKNGKLVFRDYVNVPIK